MNSRLSGDYFEYSIVAYLQSIGIKHSNIYTDEKGKKLSSKYEFLPVGKRLSQQKKINQAILKILNTAEDILSYELINDNCGKKGDSTDIIIHTNIRDIKISCKVNNFSIKHQRPSSLPSQLNMNSILSKQYILEYKNLNDAYYQQLKEKGQFNKIEKSCIFQMYNDFNTLVFISMYIDQYGILYSIYYFL